MRRLRSLDSRLTCSTLLLCLILALAMSCGGNGESDDGIGALENDDAAEAGAPDAEVAEPVEVPIVASEAYLARKAEYLQVCSDENGPGEGHLAGQACRVKTGQTVFDEDALTGDLGKMIDRQDTADFALAKVLRVLRLDRDAGALQDDMREQLEDAVLGFKYWIDEPGQDKMCYWTENHQVLYHSGELIAGQLFPEQVFVNNGMTGAEHVEHAKPYLMRWMERRMRYGFSEWHSNVYFNEDMPALLNLVDFAEDPDIRERARMVFDVMALDLATNYYKGLFATVHGRTYHSKFIDGLKDSTRDAAWLLFGLGERGSDHDFTASFLATGDYTPPPILEDFAAATAARFEHRQRDGLDVADGPDAGIGYETDDDIIFWAGMAALLAPDVIDGTMAMLTRLELWDGFLFGDLPDEIKQIFQAWAGTPKLREFAKDLEPASRGMGLESMSTYTWRTPHYQLSGAQDHRPSLWGTQTLMWQATLDDQCYVLTSYPATLSFLEGLSVSFAGEWIGGWYPRATLYRNVGVIQYRPASGALLDSFMNGEHSHALFPRERFDEVREGGGWVFGRKGQAYVALWSQHETDWAEDNDIELIADAPENVWVVELGSVEEHASFDAFVEAVEAAPVSVDELVRYTSPTIGAVEVGWTGPMTVDGAEVDLGPYERFEGAQLSQPWGTDRLELVHGGLTLELDFSEGVRRVLQSP
jgi:hypothetical protein